MLFNYPNKNIYKNNHKPTNIIYGKRGMSLENDINISNQYYLDKEIAVIHKKPTPIKIVNVNYPKRSAATITKAYFKQPSTTDYNGIYNGYYIDFEAKETKNISSFPLSNFHEHQIKHLKACFNQKGICFAILKFVKSNELYLLPASLIFKYWDRKEQDRKSIPKKDIVDNGFKIDYGLNPIIPYLKYVDLLINKSKGENDEGSKL